MMYIIEKRLCQLVYSKLHTVGAICVRMHAATKYTRLIKKFLRQLVHSKAKNGGMNYYF